MPLHTKLSMINIPFDVIGISETKEQIGNKFITNVELRGYSMYSQPSKGGCAISVEISNKRDKNLFCCCLYRHPSSDITKFIDHMTSILQKVQKENKTLFIMSDFNINLYNYCFHTETSDFINLMVSKLSSSYSYFTSHKSNRSLCYNY